MDASHAAYLLGEDTAPGPRWHLEPHWIAAVRSLWVVGVVGLQQTAPRTLRGRGRGGGQTKTLAPHCAQGKDGWMDARHATYLVG
jgi:hypothetical protein